MQSAWTPERRKRQAASIRETKPWLKSTGPRTSEGKKVSSQNATRFLHNPEARRAYDALQLLIKLPFDSPLRDQLSTVARSGLDDTDWGKIDRELWASWSYDDIPPDPPVNGPNDDDDALHRLYLPDF